MDAFQKSEASGPLNPKTLSPYQHPKYPLIEPLWSIIVGILGITESNWWGGGKPLNPKTLKLEKGFRRSSALGFYRA